MCCGYSIVTVQLTGWSGRREMHGIYAVYRWSPRQARRLLDNMTNSSEYRDPPTSRKALTNFIAGAIGIARRPVVIRLKLVYITS